MKIKSLDPRPRPMDKAEMRDFARKASTPMSALNFFGRMIPPLRFR